MPTRTTIDVIMEPEMAEALEQRAESMCLPVDQYIGLVLMTQLSANEELTLMEQAEQCAQSVGL